MNSAKNQHYVPQFLLRNFADPASGLLHVFDKKTEKVFATNPRNVAAERDFYDIDVELGTVTLEPGLAHLEAQAATVLGQIIESESLAGLTPEDKGLLSAFLAAQFVRTRHVRENLMHINREMAKFLRRLGFEPDQVENFKEFSEEDVKKLAVAITSKSTEDFAPHFFDKAWLLVRTTTDHPFFISDNPIALHNDRPAQGLYGNLGLAVPGIQIYLPLSPSLSLQLLCRTLEDQIQTTHRLFTALSKINAREFKRRGEQYAFVHQLSHGLNVGTPVDLKPLHVERANSLQVWYGSRFVFCSRPQFELVTRMLRDSEKYRTGPLMQLR